MRFIIVGCHYNNEEFVDRWAHSVYLQNYPNFIVLTINDASTDRTEQFLSGYFPMNGHLLINNKSRMGYAYNLTQTLYNSPIELNNEDVIVVVDGDDYLPENNVLYELSKYYLNPETWMTYGSFRRTNNQPCHCRGLNHNIPIRKHSFVMSHLRSYKWFLFKNFPIEHLIKDGEYISCASDLAIMTALAEMAGPTHIKFSSRVMYVYNMDNPLSIFKQKDDPYPEMEKYIRSLPNLQQKTREELVNGTCNWR